MRLPTFNGWLGWSYNDKLYSVRQNKNCKYKFIVNKQDSINQLSYKEALLYNAEMAREYFSDKFDLLFSGGIDSEVVLRTFKDLGITHNTYIFKYNNNYNRRDYETAINVAENLNVPYKVIDFNLENFFENDAYDLFTKSKCIRAGRLVHLKLCELVDNIPVMGEAEPYWLRELGADYTIKSGWKFPMNESNHNCSIYLHSLGRENLCDFYEFTPNVIAAFQAHPLTHKLLNDDLPGKISNWSNRISMHQEIWPDIVHRYKLTGYESENYPGFYPNFFTDFQEKMTAEVGKGDEYWLTPLEVNEIFY